MTLDIPEDERELLLRWLTDESVPIDGLLTALAKVPPAVNVARLTTDLQALEGVDVDDLDVLVYALASLCRTATRFEEDGRDDLTTALFESIVGEASDPEVRDRFARRVEQVVGSPTLRITAKAANVILETPKRFCTARTVSEVRPLFDLDLAPMAVMLVHELRIAYHPSDDDLKELYVTMTRKDLVQLQKVVERALRKHTKLHETSKALSVPIVD